MKKEIGPFRALMRPLLRVARSVRLLAFPAHTRHLRAMGLVGASFRRSDPYCFINREHYLSRSFNVRQRIGNVLLHYRHELNQFDEVYHARVYRESGLLLWEERVDDVHICIVLVSSGEYRGEGEVSAYLLVNGNWAACMSFSFVDATGFGLPEGPILFVTRTQINPGLEVELFRRCYRQNSPQYFCLAAISGIAMANDARSIAAIPCEAQVNYDPQFDAGFRNSYCNFWRQFGAQALDGRAYLLDIPFSLPPLASIAPKHRARSADRRRHWGRITQQTEATLRARRLGTGARNDAPKVWLYSACFASTNLLAEFAHCA
jgi:uncharacterized protein